MGTGTRIAVLGTGANGAGIAADLTRAGLDVSLIDQWPEHVDAMRRGGIQVTMPDRTETTRVQAYQLCDVATMTKTFDIVFLVVNAYDTRWATELIKPLLADDGLVIGLQNGMTVADVLSIVGPEHTLGAVIEVASNMWEPGKVNRQTPPEASWFAVGSVTPATAGREQEVADVLRHAGTVEISDDIHSSKWMKLIANAAEHGPSAVLNVTIHAATQVPGMWDFMMECGTEAAQAAVADGAHLRPVLGMEQGGDLGPAEYTKEVFGRVLSSFSTESTQGSVLQDLIKGRRSEIDDIHGHVVRTAERLGLDAPANAAVVQIGRKIELGQRRYGLHNVEALFELRDELTHVPQ